MCHAYDSCCVLDKKKVNTHDELEYKNKIANRGSQKTLGLIVGTVQPAEVSALWLSMLRSRGILVLLHQIGHETLLQPVSAY